MNRNLISISLFALGLMSLSSISRGDDDDNRPSRADVAPVSDQQYQSECGSCHFAYPPGLLPEASWRKLMSGLDRHFGDDASLDARTSHEVLSYLTSNSADKSDAKRSQKIMRSLDGRTPIRITGTPYFIAKHDEIPPRLVHGNDQVRSFSNCAACHLRAQRGSFGEREIRIAGYGKWED